MDKFFIENEAATNKKCANIFLFTLFLLLIIYLMDFFGLFVVDLTAMTIGTILGSICMVLPTILNRYIRNDRVFLKYIYVTLASVFILVLTTTISYHIYVVYLYPVAIASLYYSRKLNVYASVTTSIAILIGSVAAHNINILRDLNFNNMYEVLVYNVFPKIIILLCLAMVCFMTTERNMKTIMEQREISERFNTYHHEMVIGFATMIEKRDHFTADHIRRTKIYATMLAEELRRRDIYSDVIDDEFIENLNLAVPMHDVGKVFVPDSILKKTDRLSLEEFEIMKKHPTNGGKIIKETFCHSGNDKFNEMAYDVASFHHEKWNGKGYPNRLYGYNIPLSARIMGLVNSFDEVTNKRARDNNNFSIDEVFDFLQKNKGEDFEPILAEVFISLRPQIEEILKGEE